MIVYKAKNKINGKVYVGLTRFTIKRRLAGHLCTGRSPFQLALRKYGSEAFEFSVLAEAENYEELCRLEIEWITKLDCRAPRGYNLTAGGEGMLDPDGSIRKKISLAAQGRKASAETKAKLSLARRGRKFSAQHRQRIGDAHRGKVYSVETRRKIGIASRKKKMSSLSRLMIWMWVHRDRRPDQVRSMDGVKRDSEGRFIKAAA